MTISYRQYADLGCISFSLSVDKMFRTQNRGCSINIDVALCMLPHECVKRLIYSDVITSHVIIEQWQIADMYTRRFEPRNIYIFGFEPLIYADIIDRSRSRWITSLAGSFATLIMLVQGPTLRDTQPVYG